MPRDAPAWHEYRILVECVGEPVGDDMQIVDFAILDAAWDSIAPPNWTDFNDTCEQTSVEWFANHFLDGLRAVVPEVTQVTVWEDELHSARATVDAA